MIGVARRGAPREVASELGDVSNGLYRPGVNYRTGTPFLSCRRWFAGDESGYQRFRSAKVGLDRAYLEMMMADVVRTVRELGWMPDVTTAPPQGVPAAFHYASELARLVAEAMGVQYQQTFEARLRGGGSHHPRKERVPAKLIAAPRGRVLCIDDFATSGATIKESLECLRASGAEAMGLVWVYGERK